MVKNITITLLSADTVVIIIEFNIIINFIFVVLFKAILATDFTRLLE